MKLTSTGPYEITRNMRNSVKLLKVVQLTRRDPAAVHAEFIDNALSCWCYGPSDALAGVLSEGWWWEEEKRRNAVRGFQPGPEWLVPRALPSPAHSQNGMCHLSVYARHIHSMCRLCAECAGNMNVCMRRQWYIPVNTRSFSASMHSIDTLEGASASASASPSPPSASAHRPQAKRGSSCSMRQSVVVEFSAHRP
jgi:hypothetical protein